MLSSFQAKIKQRLSDRYRRASDAAAFTPAGHDDPALQRTGRLVKVAMRDRDVRTGCYRRQ